VYDFRIYNKALTDTDIQTDVLSVGTKISSLDAAYLAANAVKSIYDSPYKVSVNADGIRVSGVTLADKVSLFDVAGRQIKVTNPSYIKATSGVYVLKINEYVSKVVVE